jgi:hypothetical protein
MGKHKPASERQTKPSSVAAAEALRAPEQKVPREHLGDRDGVLKGLAEEPVLDLGPTPVEGGSPAQRGVELLASVLEGVADHIKNNWHVGQGGRGARRGMGVVVIFFKP